MWFDYLSQFTNGKTAVNPHVDYEPPCAIRIDRTMYVTCMNGGQDHPWCYPGYAGLVR